MRITFVLEHASMAGGMRVVAIYADRLRRRGHDVFVVSTPRKPIPLRAKLSCCLRGSGWPRHPNPDPSHLDGMGLDHVILKRWRPVTDRDVPDADVVIATWWETAEWVAALSPSKGAKAYLIQHHELEFDAQPRDRVAATWRLPLHKITISNWLTEMARDTYGDPYASHVPNSVDMGQFHAPPRGKQRQPTVGMLYSPVLFKGCEIGFEAIRRASGTLPSLQLVSFGSSPPSAHLPLPPGARYTQSPAQHTIKDLYAQCDVWLCASRTEGFHLPPLEAMACRCPVVSTRVGGPMDVIEDGKNGYLVDVGNVDALADRLTRVLTLPEEEWLAMSNAAHATAADYTWDDATDLLEAAFRTAIRRRGESIPAPALAPMQGDLSNVVAD